MIRNQSGQVVGAQMVNATTGAAFSGSVTVYVTVDGGTQAVGSVGSGACTSEGNGYFTYAPSATETNGSQVAFTFIGTGAVPATIQVYPITLAQQATLGGGSPGDGTINADGLIKAALMELGAYAPGETLDATDANTAFDRLNEWIDSLGTERLTMYYVLRTTKALTASTASYTVGSSGDINIQRPTYLERAGMVVDNTASTLVEIPIPVLTDQEYARLTVKGLESALTTSVYYDHNWSAGLGRIYVLPIPTVSTGTLVIYTPQALAQFANLTSYYTFPPGYRRFLRYGLACELWATYAQVANIEWLTTQRDEARANLKRANYRIQEMPMDAGASGRPGGVYSIYSDGYIH